MTRSLIVRCPAEVDVVLTFKTYEQARIVKNLSCGAEIHRVLFDIRGGFDAVPFEFHRSSLYGTAVSRHPYVRVRYIVRTGKFNSYLAQLALALGA